MKISIIGTGRIGVLLEKDTLRYKPCTHLGAIKTLAEKNKSLCLDFLCDINMERLNTAFRFAKDHRVGTDLKITQDYKMVISRTPEILVISCDTTSHSDITVSAIKSGIKKIVLEKPVCLKKSEAERLRNLAKKNGAHIWVNYERRYHPKYIRLRDCVKFEKPYGKLLHYRGWFASTNPSLYYKNKFNEGALLHDTTHLLDLVQFLCGKISRKRSLVDRAPNNTSLHKLLLKHDNNMVGEIWTTTSNSFFHFELELMFEKGRINVGNGFFREEKIQKSKLYQNFISLAKPLFHEDTVMKPSSNPFIKLYSDVLQNVYYDDYFQDACENVSLLT